MKQKRNSLQKDVLFILISSFIVVVAWISFNIYHIYATSTVSQDVQLQLDPISPVFDPQTMEQLKTRESIQPLFESQKSPLSKIPATPAQISTTPSPTPSISGIPETIPSESSRFGPTNSPINRSGQ